MHKYWDTSGNLIRAIEEALPELECMGIGKRGFEFKATRGESAARECGFNWDQTWFEANVDLSAGQFEKVAEVFWPLVVDGHGIDKLARVGSRHWLVFGTETLADASHLLGELKVWSFRESLADLGEPDARGVALRMVHHGPERRIRLALTAGDHVLSGKKVPGILVDIDFSMEEDLSAGGFDLSGFLQWNQRYLRDKIHRVLRARQ